MTKPSVVSVEASGRKGMVADKEKEKKEEK